MPRQARITVIYAHSLKDRPESDWEPLDTHAAAVAKLAREFASAFAAGDWGELLGLWHDLGKASAKFQDYISRTGDPDAAESQNGGDHSAFGARLAVQKIPGLSGQLLAFCIAGHHAGLADANATDSLLERSTLAYKLDPARYEIEPVTVADNVPVLPKLAFPLTKPDPNDWGFPAAFFARMLFSALIDADRTATEQFCNPDQAAERNRPKPALADLRPLIDGCLAAKRKPNDVSRVNKIRAQVLSECLNAASLPSGFFSLNVPTGGGKTWIETLNTALKALTGASRSLCGSVD
jgi:CRISPR-associated endonuclease/helicase Cas3